MTKCEICKYQKDCPDVVEENSVYCLAHRRIPKNFNNEYIEKQQLISFLEDKIKDITDYAVSFGLFIDKDISHEIDIKKQIYQEVLNFVNKGGKE